MRWSLVLLLLALCCSRAHAQEQENKLIDRIMRPNMSLANSSQNKKFAAVEGTSIDKKFEARAFYPGNMQTTKSFSGAKSFLSRTFGTGKFARAEAAAEARTNADLAYASTQFQEQRKISLGRASTEAGKTAGVRDFSGTRPFLVKGTRQEQLNQQNRPMTIDEVRELLNTNK